MANLANTVIALRVQNHPGVMSHITGLFARRNFNLEGILCGPTGDGSESRMFLLVNNDERLEQIVKQVSKLYDVVEAKVQEDYDHSLFLQIEDILSGVKQC